MKTLFLLLLLLAFVATGLSQTGADDGSSVAVLSFKWAKSRQAAAKPVIESNTPALSAMAPANRVYERNKRVNDQAGMRDPNADTLDGRNAALEKSVQEARAPQPKAVDGFAYRVKVRNASTKVIEILFWEYQFIDPSNPATVTRRQFLCGVNIKPTKDRELQAFSVGGPTEVVSVATLTDKSATPLQEKIVINRVEYSDGSIWQRKDWNVEEVKLGIKRALATPWGTEMCRAL